MKRKIAIALAVICVIIIGIMLYQVNVSMNQEKNEIVHINLKNGCVCCRQFKKHKRRIKNRKT